MVIDHQINPEKYTQEQLEENYNAADAAYVAAAYVAAATVCSNYWLNKYFKETCENKQDYIDAINKDNKQ